MTVENLTIIAPVATTLTLGTIGTKLYSALKYLPVLLAQQVDIVEFAKAVGPAELIAASDGNFSTHEAIGVGARAVVENADKIFSSPLVRELVVDLYRSFYPI